MKLVTLTRFEYSSTGIFGNIIDDKDSFELSTLEHSYPEPETPISHSTSWEPKIMRGTYTCVRGLHQLEPTPLHPAPKPFETFEITGIPEFQGKKVTKCLFHPGNAEGDSRGCVLLGLVRHGPIILSSRDAFDYFMKTMVGIEKFKLVIK